MSESVVDADQGAGQGAADTAAQVIDVLSGNPSAEDIAALVTVLAAVGGGAEEPVAASVPSRWRDPMQAVRRSWHPRPGAWVAGNWRRN